MKISRLAAALGLGATLVALAAFSLAEPTRGGYPPDPPGVVAKKQWVFDLEYRNGKAGVRKVEPIFLNNPAATARVMGRFAVELWVGKELLDRMRFEVPLLDDPSMHRKGALSGPRFGNVSTHMRVRIADNPRATYVAVVDRSTGDVQRFAWPPEADGRLVPLVAPNAPSASPATDAGSDGGDASVDVVEAPPRDAGDAGP